MPHIPFETLADLAEKLVLDDGVPENRAETSVHLSTCGDCATSLQRLRQTISLMKSDREPDAPRDLLGYALNLFDRQPKGNAGSVLRRLVAALTFDSENNLTPAFGVRSGTSGSRQLLYSAAGYDVELRLSRQEDKWILAGQVLSEGCEGAQVSLTSTAASDESRAETLSDLCEFNFSSVPPGNYKLDLRLSDLEVEIPEIELEA